LAAVVRRGATGQSTGPRLTAVFHSGEMTGPAKTFAPRLAALAERIEIDTVFPGPGVAIDAYRPFSRVWIRSYGPAALGNGHEAAVHAISRLGQDVLNLRALLAQTRPDVVLVLTSFLPAALFAARLVRARSIVYAAEIIQAQGRSDLLWEIASRSLLRVTGTLANHVVACSKTVATQYASLPVPTTTIYPGIAVEQTRGQRQRMRHALGIAAGDPCIAVIGNVSYGRGQDLALRAMPFLRRHFDGARCLIVGRPLANDRDIAYANDLIFLSDTLGLRNTAVFLGFAKEIADVYAAADVVLNPARVHEGFGRVAFEALSAGRPVVATEVGAIPEVLRDGKDALLVDPGSPEAIASALARLLKSPALSERLVASGQARVKHDLTESQGTAAFADVCARLFPRSQSVLGYVAP
jgi:glycosyltransferase involved in cell wall biosynthesis